MSQATETAKALIENYIEGTVTSDVALLKEIFHEDAQMTGYLGADLLNGGPEPFYQALETNEVSSDYNARITSFVEGERIASVTLVEENLLDMSFENHFHLIQLPDETWRISSKLFRHF